MSTIYARTWAINTVISFLEKYGRATDFFADAVGMDRQDCRRSLVEILRRDQRRWETLKHVIKDIEKHRREEFFRRMSDEERRYYLTYVKWDAQNHFIDGKKLPEI